MARTVDLSALGRELRGTGYSPLFNGDDELEIEFEVTTFRVRNDGMVLESDGTDMTEAVLTIARHVAPPEPSLGDLLRRAEALGWRPVICKTEYRNWFARGERDGQRDRLVHADTPEAAMAGLLALIEGDGDGH